MPISADRISRDIDAIAAFSEAPPSVGYSRPTFSRAWVAARDYVIAQAQAAGCTHRIDAAGNVFIRPAAIAATEKRWLSGSHIDSVPTGGKFDGVMGIVVPLEVLRSGPVPLELVIWAEEEGTTFGLGMIGSRLAVGDLTADSIANFKNKAGQNFIEAGQPFGVRPADLIQDRFQANRYNGLIEIHAEQGPEMWDKKIPLGAVHAIAGRKQFAVTLAGQANHAGSTPMAYRRDALVAAASIVTGVRKMAMTLGANTVATVGKLEVEPNAINVVPGAARLNVDLRSADPNRLRAGQEAIERLIDDCGVEGIWTLAENQPPVTMHQHVVELLVHNGAPHRTVSGALHDAAILAPHLPTAMIFVASKDGISHNPAEFSRIDDIAAAAEVLERLVKSA